LENLNQEIIQNCNNLDITEDKIKELLAQKTSEHIAKAEPYY